MIKISACSNFGRRRFGGGSAVIDEKRIQADNLAFTECVHKISAFYVDYKCPKSLFCVGSKLCAHGVRGLEAMRIPKRQICVGSKGCAHVVCAYEAMRIPKRDMCAGNKGVGISNTQLITFLIHFITSLQK